MATDPKKLLSVSQQIEKHINAYEQRQKVVDSTLAECEKRLSAANMMANDVASKGAEHLKALATSSQALDGAVAMLTSMKTDVKKVSADYEMVQRRYLDSKKTMNNVTETLMEKQDAYLKNKHDKKAVMEFELAGKAGEKLSVQFYQLLMQAQEMVPSKYNKNVDWAVTELQPLLVDYEKVLKEALKAFNPKAFAKFEEEMSRHLKK